MVAITQVRNPNSPGRAYFDRKLAEAKTKKEALRALKRRISDIIYRQLVADALELDPGGQLARSVAIGARSRLAFSEAGEAVPVAMMDGSAWPVAVLRCCTSRGEQVASPRDELLDGLRGSAGDFLDRGGHAVIPILAM